MTTNLSASAGTKIYIGPITAADDVSAYAALSYTEVGGVETISEFGDQSGQITFTGLGDSRVRKLKGARDAGDVTVAAAFDARDAGQIAMRAAEATKFSYAIKVVYEDSPDANDTDSVDYFHAKVMSARRNVGGANNVLMETYVLAIDTAIVSALSEAVS
ncbi:MAG: hypothetical protein ACK4RV_10195 [Caulobacter sp.]